MIIIHTNIRQQQMGLQFLVQVPRSPNTKPISNYISTTKYNIITYLPLSLLLQFKRYANIYFLVCAIMQSIPLISPLSPFSAVAPLIFVLSLSMARQGYQDYKRWRSDEHDNSQTTQLCQNGNWAKAPWKDVKTGDFIRIAKDQVLPADMIILLCSSPSGISYVETSSLDGEKNLKPKFAIPKIQLKYNQMHQLPNFRYVKAQASCSMPSAQHQAFESVLSIYINNQPIKESLNKKNALLRGCKLKNTDWAIGMTIYTGKDTAIMMNGSEPFTKISNIESRVNKTILVILALQILSAFGSAIYCYFGCIRSMAFEQLLNNTTAVNCYSLAGISFGSYFILYSTFIPISLIVSLQFVKVFQGYFMSVDKEMYCSSNDHFMECHTVSINEELGQIEYILTDKTGTLTCNKMEFRNVVIGNEIYGESLIFDKVSNNFDFSRLTHRFQSCEVTAQQAHFDARGLSFDLSNLEAQSSKKSQMKHLIELMFFMITTCHECVPSPSNDYQGSSPDEVALLKAAKNIGFVFKSSQNKVIIVQYDKKQYTFEVLRVCEFDSTRKRMSIVLRWQGKIVVFVKGADSSLERILAADQPYLKVIKEKTNEMTRTGLRSLWFAHKTYSSDANPANLSIQQIQSNLSLIGATGIEDRLQDYVPETIYSLRQGGIKFIMLTGDKLQTAQNIALACKLIEDGKLIANQKQLNSFVQYVENCLDHIQQIVQSPVIDGSTLSFIQCQKQLLYIIQNVKSVVFCRVTPKQKAQIVRLVKQLGKLTLAIGDGANDVNMIMQAHVGVGIFGEEGTRAAQVANYAIGEFCLLWKLLLYYGRLNYMRISQMILYFFYKNMVFTIVQVAYCFYNMGSGESFWLSWSITFYNMVFTFFPVVIRAVFQVDLQISPNKKTFNQLSKGTCDKQTLYSYYPGMYIISQKNKLFTNMIFFSWFFLGVLQGIACLMITLYSLGDQDDTSGFRSYETGFYFAQISAYTSVIIVVTIKLAINVKIWNWILVFGFVVPSLGAYVLYLFISNILQEAVTASDVTNLLSMPIFYIAQVLCVGGMFSIDFLLFSVEATKNNFQNYLKFRTLKKSSLNTTNLEDFMLELKDF